MSTAPVLAGVIFSHRIESHPSHGPSNLFLYFNFEVYCETVFTCNGQEFGVEVVICSQEISDTAPKHRVSVTKHGTLLFTTDSEDSGYISVRIKLFKMEGVADRILVGGFFIPRKIIKEVRYILQSTTIPKWINTTARSVKKPKELLENPNLKAQ
jgi:hypothetical protein